MKIAKDCLLIVLSYCDLTLVVKCLGLNKEIKHCIETNEIGYCWDKQDCFALATNHCDDFLVKLFKNNALNRIPVKLIYDHCVYEKCYRVLECILNNLKSLDDLFLSEYADKSDKPKAIQKQIDSNFEIYCSHQDWELTKTYLRIYDNQVSVLAKVDGFIRACKYGNLEMVKLLLKNIEFNLDTDQKTKATFASITGNHFCVFEYLYEMGLVDMDTGIQGVAKRNWIKWLKKVLDKIDLSSVNFQQVFDSAICENYSLEMVQFLLSNEKVQTATIHVNKTFCQLYKLILNNENNSQKFKELIDENLNWIIGDLEQVENLLLKSIGNLHFVKHLLPVFKLHATENQISGLFLATCKQGDLEMFNLLVTTDFKMKNFAFEECLKWACYNGDLEMVKRIFLVDPTIDCNKVIPDTRNLYDDIGDQDITKQLKENKRILPNAINGNAFMCAIGSDNGELIQFLLNECNADITFDFVSSCVVAKKNLFLFKAILDKKDDLARFPYGHDICDFGTLEYFLLFLNHKKFNEKVFDYWDLLNFVGNKKFDYLIMILEKFPHSFGIFKHTIQALCYCGYFDFIHDLLKKFDKNHVYTNGIIVLHTDFNFYRLSDKITKDALQALIFHPRVIISHKLRLLVQLIWVPDECGFLGFLEFLVSSKEYSLTVQELFADKDLVSQFCVHGKLKILKFGLKHGLVDHSIFDSQLVEEVKKSGHVRVLDFIQRKISNYQ